MQNIKRIWGILFMVTLLANKRAIAQRHTLSPAGQYFRNGYTWNPAYAGRNAETHLYGLVSNGLTGFDGAPKMFGLSADTHFGANSGAGFQLFLDKTGVLQRYMIMGSYAYTINMTEEESFSVGANLSYYKEQLDNSVVYSNGQIDPAVKDFNSKGGLFDGDLGIAYESDNVELGLAMYNLRSYVQDKQELTTGQGMAQAQAAYIFDLDEEKNINLKPLMAYKFFQKETGIFTAAMQFEYNHLFHASLYWQSSNTLMGGAGLIVKKLGELNFFYNTSTRYSHNAQYELGLKVNIK